MDISFKKNLANRLSEDEYRDSAKKRRKLSGRGFLFNTEWPTPVAFLPATKVHSITCNTYFGIDNIAVPVAHSCGEKILDGGILSAGVTVVSP